MPWRTLLKILWLPFRIAYKYWQEVHGLYISLKEGLVFFCSIYGKLFDLQCYDSLLPWKIKLVHRVYQTRQLYELLQLTLQRKIHLRFCPHQNDTTLMASFCLSVEYPFIRLLEISGRWIFKWIPFLWDSPWRFQQHSFPFSYHVYYLRKMLT